MQNHSPLQELTKKLDEIKESWQIYTIFETEKKRFNEEFDALKKDKESLLESFNDISAKNALLLADNKELEQRNQALKNEIAIKEQHLASLNHSQDLEIPHSNTLESEPLDFNALETQYHTFKKLLKSTKELSQNIPLERPKAIEKLEVSYQKHQRLLANPAKDYVLLESAELLFDLLIKIDSRLKALDLESSKLEAEIHNLQNNITQSTQKMLDDIQDLEIHSDHNLKADSEQISPKNPQNSDEIPQNP